MVQRGVCFKPHQETGSLILFGLIINNNYFCLMVNPEGRSNTVSELFRTEKGVIYQDDRNNRFTLEFMDRKAAFKVQEFLHFKKAVDSISLEELFLNDHSDLQIIHHRNTDQLFLITLCELVALKELLSGAKVMLELNSIICSRLAPCKL